MADEKITEARKKKNLGLGALISSVILVTPIIIAGCLGYEPSKDILSNNFDTYCFVGGLASMGLFTLGAGIYATAKGELNYYSIKGKSSD